MDISINLRHQQQQQNKIDCKLLRGLERKRNRFFLSNKANKCIDMKNV